MRPIDDQTNGVWHCSLVVCAGEMIVLRSSQAVQTSSNANATGLGWQLDDTDNNFRAG